jgi:hypothetical protein
MRESSTPRSKGLPIDELDDEETDEQTDAEYEGLVEALLADDD